MPTNSNNPENLTEKELNFGYWFVAHRLLLRKIFAGFLIGICAILYGFSLYHTVDYFFVTGVGERESLRELSTGIDYTELHKAYKPLDLKLGAPLVFGGARDRYDFVARIENRNSTWWATFKYRFVGTGFESPTVSGFVLPGDDKHLTLLATPAGSRPRGLQVELQDVTWMRIDKHEIPDIASYLAARTDLKVTDVLYTPAATRDRGAPSIAKFVVKNTTAFSFWRIDFSVFLLRGATVQAVNIVSADALRSGEARTLEVSWFESLPPTDRVEVKPSVNVFDQSVYMR